MNDMHDFGFGMTLQSPTHPSFLQPPYLTSPRKPQSRNSRHQKAESIYDGSDYGPDSDNEDTDVPPILAKRIRDIETVTRMSMNTDTLSEDGGVIKRTTNALKDLGPQSNIENGVTRLITAYTSMATH